MGCCLAAAEHRSLQTLCCAQARFFYLPFPACFRVLFLGQMMAEADRLRPCYGRRTGRRIPALSSAKSRYVAAAEGSMHYALFVSLCPQLSWSLLVLLLPAKVSFQLRHPACEPSYSFPLFVLLSLSRANEQKPAIAVAAVQPLPRQWALLVALWLLKELKANLSWHRLRGIGRLLTSSSWRYFLSA